MSGELFYPRFLFPPPLGVKEGMGEKKQKKSNQWNSIRTTTATFYSPTDSDVPKETITWCHEKSRSATFSNFRPLVSFFLPLFLMFDFWISTLGISSWTRKQKNKNSRRDKKWEKRKNQSSGGGTRRGGWEGESQTRRRMDGERELIIKKPFDTIDRKEIPPPPLLFGCTSFGSWWWWLSWEKRGSKFNGGKRDETRKKKKKRENHEMRMMFNKKPKRGEVQEFQSNPRKRVRDTEWKLSVTRAVSHSSFWHDTFSFSIVIINILIFEPFIQKPFAPFVYRVWRTVQNSLLHFLHHPLVSLLTFFHSMCKSFISSCVIFYVIKKGGEEGVQKSLQIILLDSLEAAAEAWQSSWESEPKKEFDVSDVLMVFCLMIMISSIESFIPSSTVLNICRKRRNNKINVNIRLMILHLLSYAHGSPFPFISISLPLFDPLHHLMWFCLLLNN